ncbi:hypothetical protein BJX63DRAFT_434233 [Aspergillus granulosus]|uniref:Uncharacterized protein n=1 Tax=Aspergillus granulosus TaxID=176169 RepID=A0ABR4H6M8_9EURO
MCSLNEEEKTGSAFDPLYCAQLYSTIIRTGFHKSQRAQKGDSLRRNWFDVSSRNPNLETCRDPIPLPLVPFLEAIETVVGPDGDPYARDIFIHNLRAVSSPTSMFITYQGAIHDCLVLIPNNLDEPTRLGIRMEPGLLITYASNEDYRAVLFKEVDPANNPFCNGPNCWEVIPWNEYILNQTLEAYDGLVEAISSRLPAPSLSSQGDGDHRAMVATEDTLPTAIKGFPRAFLLKALKPRFCYIAPGLTVYDPANPPLPVRVNQETQYIDHPYRELFCHQAEHDPLVLFPRLSWAIRKNKLTYGSPLLGLGWNDLP